MKVYQTNEIRNLVLLGNSGSGKTTLAEAMMYEGGVISRRGDIASKTTVSDYREIEQEKGSSIFSTVLYTEWLGKKLNIIDTPGADDFIGGVVSALNVANTGVLLINAQNGVEVGTENIFRYTEHLHTPLILVVNQLDHEKANFDHTLEDAKRAFGNKVIPVQYPINPGTGYNAAIDLLMMKMLKWPAQGGKPEILDIPASEQGKADEMHAALVEAAAEGDENLMELFFDKGTLSEEEMVTGIKESIIARNLLPVFCISAKGDMGIRRLMEVIGLMCPVVSEMPAPTTKDGQKVECNANAPTSIFIYKNTIEPHLGEVLYFKVMSGVLKEGMDLININKSAKERMGQLFAVAGKNRTKVTELVAGDLGATVKLKETKTNHTLNDKGVEWEFTSIPLPEPKHRTAIKASNEADEEKLADALHKMHEEDPSLILEYSKELRQMILYGQGEFHLNIVKWQLDHLYKISADFIAPRIPYRETITKSAVASYRHKKQSGGAGQFGEVHLYIEPHVEGKPDPSGFKIEGKEAHLNIKGKEEINLPWGGKLIFYNCIVGGVIEARFLPAILKGIMEKMEIGPLTGSYARDIRVAVFDGKMHPVDSNEISFKIAGMKAFVEAFRNAGPKIMEPINDVEVLTPAEKMGDVMSDLQNRRALIVGMNSEKGFEKVIVKAPLAEMHKYSTTLSSITGGRAMFSMKFSEYQQVPKEVQDELLKVYATEAVDD